MGKIRFNIFFLILIITVSLFSFYPDRVLAHNYNMSYLYFGYTDTFIEQVEKTNDSLDMVAPSYFDLHDDGTLDDKVDINFVNAMHDMNIKVVPFLSNHWDREKGRRALENKENLVDELVNAIIKYDLDGINVDLENLNQDDRDEYTEFVKLLREKLPEEKEVSVAVAAKTYDAKEGWHASYDYTELAKYSDYLMLMTYDESYYGSNPGPVASLDFVEKAIQYALEKVPSDKIVLGIPFYGRYWPDRDSIGGRGVSLTVVEELINKYGGKVYFDEEEKSPYARIYIPPGTKEYVHGRLLTSGVYTIWYENDNSIKIKLNLVEKYDLHGTGSWSLNEADAKIWDYYTSWLNGEHYFIDAEDHWAELDILEMLDRGWMVGTSDYKFSPNESLTRAQGAVVLVRALGLEIDNSTESTFSDVNDSYWAKSEIETAYQYGLIKGKSEGIFEPDETLTREEMAVMISRLLEYDNMGISQELINPFDDLSETHWAYNDILLLSSLNIFSGYTDGGFHPDDFVTRSQMAALMNRISTDIDNINNMY